jgi:ABC-type proline/glycine betaine transport system ATPase subunit
VLFFVTNFITFRQEYNYVIELQLFPSHSVLNQISFVPEVKNLKQNLTIMIEILEQHMVLIVDLHKNNLQLNTSFGAILKIPATMNEAVRNFHI